MRYAVLADVHGNLEALRAVLSDCRDQIDGMLCLGDIVGYGADPAPCVELLAERADVIVAGNHEHGAAGLLSLSWFNSLARAALQWTGTALDADHRAYLARLPLRAVVDDATLVHASPLRPDEWEYLVTPHDGLEAFAGFDTRLCFVGHSHQPAHWSLGSSGSDYAARVSRLALEHGRRYIVNVGSVGQPRDRDPRACYAVWDSDGRHVELRRVAYDAGEARRKIIAAGLPRFLGDRLANGR